MKVELRLEEETDYRFVEELTREAFWNLHLPGCDEHFLIHKMRAAPEFIKELDYVAVYNSKIIGNIVYVNTAVINGNTIYKVLTFGPVSVLPEFQGKGVGSKLINHSISLAREMGHKAVIIYGDPDYYKKFGFIASKNFNITNKEGKYPAALLVLELYENALNGIFGTFDEGRVYEIDNDEAGEFDKSFPMKEKGYKETQDRFKEISGKYF